MAGRISAHGAVASPDSTLQLQPANAITLACTKCGIATPDLDVIELNEAFAAVALASAQALDIDDERLNVHGGAIALGHPLACRVQGLFCMSPWNCGGEAQESVWPRCAVVGDRGMR